MSYVNVCSSCLYMYDSVSFVPIYDLKHLHYTKNGISQLDGVKASLPITNCRMDVNAKN